MSRGRVVITGLGGICSIGGNANEIWESMRQGRCGLKPLTFDRRDLKTNIGGEIASLDDSAIDPRHRPAMGRFSVLAALTAMDAFSQAKLDISSLEPPTHRRRGRGRGLGR